MGFQHTNTQNCIHQRSCSLIIAHSIHSKDKHMQCPHTHIKWPTQTCCAIAVVPLLPQSRAILQQLVEQNSRHVGFPLTCSALAPRKLTPYLLARFRDFERPEHAPRSPPGTQTWAAVYRRAPCVPRNREREKRPTGAGEKRANVKKKNTLVLSNMSTPRTDRDLDYLDPNLPI